MCLKVSSLNFDLCCCILEKILMDFWQNIEIQIALLWGNTPLSFSHGPILVELSIQWNTCKNHCGVTAVSFQTKVDECIVRGLFYQMVFKASSFTMSFWRSSRESVRPNLSSVGVALSHISTENSLLIGKMIEPKNVWNILMLLFSGILYLLQERSWLLVI